MWLPLNWLITEFIIGLSATCYIIPRLKSMFIKKGISGKDMSKNYGDKEDKDIERIPEAQVSFKIGWSDKFITNIQLPLLLYMVFIAEYYSFSRE